MTASSIATAVYLELTKDRETVHKLKIDFTDANKVKLTKSTTESNKIAEYVALSGAWEDRLIAANNLVDESSIFMVDYSSLVAKLSNDNALKMDYKNDKYFIEKHGNKNILLTKTNEYGQNKGIILKLNQFNRLDRKDPCAIQSSSLTSGTQSEITPTIKGLIDALTKQHIS